MAERTGVYPVDAGSNPVVPFPARTKLRVVGITSRPGYVLKSAEEGRVF